MEIQIQDNGRYPELAHACPFGETVGLSAVRAVTKLGRGAECLIL